MRKHLLFLFKKLNGLSPELWLTAMQAESRHRKKMQSEIVIKLLWSASIAMATRPPR